MNNLWGAAGDSAEYRRVLDEPRSPFPLCARTIIVALLGEAVQRVIYISLFLGTNNYSRCSLGYGGPHNTLADNPYEHYY